jgi:hypothetical protein
MEHPNVAMSSNNLGKLLEAAEDHQAAQKAYARALEILGKVLPADHPNLINVRVNLDRVSG